MDLDQSLTVGATPDGKVSISAVGFGSGYMSLRCAKLFEDSLHAAITNLLLPTPGFRWDEPTQDFKSCAVLMCEDPRYVTRFSDASLPGVLNVPQSAQSRTVGFVAQQMQSGQVIPQGQYISAAAPDWSPIGFPDFEDAQAAVAARIRAQGIT